ncbi:MAG: hypothetical protein H0V79_04740 [Actinobacteria bacterium]|nr:hypothetical protein [Actinomycetota bacterium]
MAPLKLVVLGTLAANPYAGMAWMHMQIAVGLQRLGHDVHYLETSSNWPYDPIRGQKVCDSRYALPYLTRVCESFGLGDRWAYRRSYSDRAWFGPAATEGERLLREADAVLNVAGATRLSEDGLQASRLVYLGTDPVYHEVTYRAGDEETRAIVDEHDDVVTYGENIGTPVTPVEPLPRQRATTRQPVLMDLWLDGPPTRDEFTTVANWRQEGREVELDGERYLWSKDAEFLKFVDLPRRSGRRLELAMNLARPETIRYGEGEPVRAWGVDEQAYALLEESGWALADAREFTSDPWPYRDYVQASRGEFTVARDLHVRLRSGWFSERSACYLAAGRPVVAQDTGFDQVLPTGEGLFSFRTMDDVLEAFEAIDGDYERHSQAARLLAEEYFRAETVLARLLADLGR